MMCYAAHPVATTKQVICISSRPKPVCCMLWPLMMLAEPRIRHTDRRRSFSPTTHQSTWSFTKAFKIKFRSHEHPLAKLRMIIGVKDISKYQVSDEAEFPSWNYAWARWRGLMHPNLPYVYCTVSCYPRCCKMLNHEGLWESIVYDENTAPWPPASSLGCLQGFPAFKTAISFSSLRAPEAENMGRLPWCTRVTTPASIASPGLSTAVCTPDLSARLGMRWILKLVITKHHWLKTKLHRQTDRQTEIW